MFEIRITWNNWSNFYKCFVGFFFSSVLLLNELFVKQVTSSSGRENQIFRWYYLPTYIISLLSITKEKLLNKMAPELRRKMSVIKTWLKKPLNKCLQLKKTNELHSPKKKQNKVVIIDAEFTQDLRTGSLLTLGNVALMPCLRHQPDGLTKM